jgi:hypothetical protein
MRIYGICRGIVDELAKRTMELSQGRAAGCLGFVNEKGYIDRCTGIIDGGVTSLPVRQLLATVADIKGLSLVEAVKLMPPNTVFLSTQPGHTGIITGIGVVDMLHMPMVNIGVKDHEICGIGISYPEQHFFDLASETEKIDLETLQARTIDEEKAIIRRSAELSLKYLDVGHQLEVVDIPQEKKLPSVATSQSWRLPRLRVQSVDRGLADELIAASLKAGQGREVAIIGKVNEQGHVIGEGKIVWGGMGMVPPRLMVSSVCPVTGKSLFEIWSADISDNAVILHTHPGGTGVMHAGDASAGPCTWGRPIIAIGHDKKGTVQGATVIELTEELIALGDKSEELDTAFFSAKTPEEEADIRNRMFGISQEYTNLCKSIEIQ